MIHCFNRFNQLMTSFWNLRIIKMNWIIHSVLIIVLRGGCSMERVWTISGGWIRVRPVSRWTSFWDLMASVKVLRKGGLMVCMSSWWVRWAWMLVKRTTRGSTSLLIDLDKAGELSQPHLSSSTCLVYMKSTWALSSRIPGLQCKERLHHK